MKHTTAKAIQFMDDFNLECSLSSEQSKKLASICLNKILSLQVVQEDYITDNYYVLIKEELNKL